MSRARNRWGWGFEDATVSAADARGAAPGVVAMLGFGSADAEEAVPLESAEVPAPRLAGPRALEGFATGDRAQRAAHAYGKSYLHTIRAFRGRYDHAPDLVARPRDEREVEAVLEWAAGANAAVIPYGGGTNGLGGLQAQVAGPLHGA